VNAIFGAHHIPDNRSQMHFWIPPQEYFSGTVERVSTVLPLGADPAVSDLDPQSGAYSMPIVCVSTLNPPPLIPLMDLPHLFA
jgi:hypothetical protein